MTLVEGVGWVLVHFIWQGFAIALVLAALLSLTSTAQARLRYALSCGASAADARRRGGQRRREHHPVR